MNLYREFSTQEQIDAEYNLERSIADFRACVDFFVNESKKTREDLDCILDMLFGPMVEETLDIFPEDGPNSPILVFIHGGYWRALSSKEFSFVARGPVAFGFTVMVTNYSLCPKVTLPEITRQSRAAISWIRRTERRFPGARRRLFLTGHSAGGHQCAVLLATPWQKHYGLPADGISGGVAISGLFDLRPLRYLYLQPMLQLNEEIIRSESPLFNIPTEAPPLLISVGGDENSEFRRQTDTFLEAWRARGLKGTYYQCGKNHFTAIEGFADSRSELCPHLADFINGRTSEG